MAEQTVTIMCRGMDNSSIQFDLPRSASFEELRRQWSQKSELPWNKHRFLFPNGSMLPDRGSLADVVTPNDFVLGIKVLPRVFVDVTVLGAAEYCCAIDVMEDTTVDDIVRLAKEAFEIKPTRPGRLLSGDTVLARDQKAMKLVTDCDGPWLLDLEITCRLYVISAAAPKLDGDLETFQADYELEAAEPRQVRRFCSQAASCLLLPDASHAHQSLLLLRERRAVRSEERLSDFIVEPEIWSAQPILFCLEVAFPVFVERASGRCEWRLAWPSETLASMTGTSHATFSDGLPVPAGEPLHSTGLLQQSCLREICSPVELCVRDDCSGKMYWVRVDPQAVVSDLREAVEAAVHGDNVGDFDLRFEGRKIDCEGLPLEQLGLGESPSLELCRRARPVLLRFGDKSCWLDAVPFSIGFDDLLRRASRALGIPLPPDTRFECPCGRVVSGENPRRARLPKNCCSSELGQVSCRRERELELHVKVPQDLEFTGEDGSRVACRLPNDVQPTQQILQDIVRLAAAQPSHQKQCLEASLLRAVLLVQGAKAVCVRLQWKLHIILAIGPSLRLPWAVSAKESVLGALQRMQQQGLMRSIKDVAVRRSRRLHVLQKRNRRKSFADFHIQEGQELTLVPTRRRGGDSVRSKDEMSDSHSVKSCSMKSQGASVSSPLSLSKNSAVKSSGSEVGGKSHASDSQFGRGRSASSTSVGPFSQARFKVHAIGFSKNKGFELNIPRISSRVSVACLLSEIAARLKCEPDLLELKQGRAKARNGDPVVEITSGLFGGGVKYATEDGTELSYGDVEDHSSVILKVGDVDLMIPGRNKRLFIGVANMDDKARKSAK